MRSFHADCNVMFFAYGQTGSGKTHTMLGGVDSLASPVPVPGWGLFPRVVHHTLEAQNKWRAQGTQSLLLASAVEFYCMGATDLNAKAGMSLPVTIDRDAQVFGASLIELTSTAQLKAWILRMYSNRTTAKTNMNDASSRSHCTFILHLHQLQSDGYLKNSFSMVDMAGSERHSKTGDQRVLGLEAYRMFNAGTPELMSVGAQGTMINLELSFIATEILKVTDMHRKGIPFKASKEMSTAATLYFFSACFDGRARLGACVTVSSSPQHGLETWFSLEYAQKLAQCSTPLKRVRPFPFDKAVKAARKAAKEAEQAFHQTNQKPQGAKAFREFMLRQGAMLHTEEILRYMEKLAAAAGHKEGDKEGDKEGNKEGGR